MTARPLDPTGRFLRLLVLLRRYENQVDHETADILADARDRLVHILERQDLTVVSAGRVMNRYDSVAAKADDVLQSAYQRLNAHLREQLVELASVQATATRGALGRTIETAGVELAPTLGLPTRAQLRSIVTTEPVRGAIMWEWWKRQRTQTRNAFQTQIRLGLTQGESIDDMIRRVRGRAIGGGRYEGGVMNTSTQNASALVRTATNQIWNQAALATYQANPDVTSAWEWFTALDARVCPICAPLDGTTYATDDTSAPLMPAHFKCRCTRLPVIDWRGLGVPAPTQQRETYPDWFARQATDTQDRILGPGRAGLIRAGTASLGDLIRSDGSRVTLAELEAEAA